jgi:hypothetical protein
MDVPGESTSREGVNLSAEGAISVAGDEADAVEVCGICQESQENVQDWGKLSSCSHRSAMSIYALLTPQALKVFFACLLIWIPCCFRESGSASSALWNGRSWSQLVHSAGLGSLT